MKTVYMVMQCYRWKDIRAHTPFPLPVQEMDNSWGFSLIYETLKELKKHHPKAKYSKLAIPKRDTDK